MAATRQRILRAFRDELLHEVLQVVDPLPHGIPSRVSMGGGNILSAVKTASGILLSGRAVLARLLPITLEPASISGAER